MPWSAVASYMSNVVPYTGKVTPLEPKQASASLPKTPSFGYLVAHPELWSELDADALRKFAPRLFVGLATANDTAKLPHLHDLYRLLVERLPP